MKYYTTMSLADAQKAGIELVKNVINIIKDNI
ncbi:hypothetical protein B0I67_000004 [Clostridium beijerinckii]|nr:hypothetical protein [Clostridium beijerinckii]